MFPKPSQEQQLLGIVVLTVFILAFLVELMGDVSKLLIVVSGDKLPDNLIMNVY